MITLSPIPTYLSLSGSVSLNELFWEVLGFKQPGSKLEGFWVVWPGFFLIVKVGIVTWGFFYYYARSSKKRWNLFHTFLLQPSFFFHLAAAERRENEIQLQWKYTEETEKENLTIFIMVRGEGRELDISFTLAKWEKWDIRFLGRKRVHIESGTGSRLALNSNHSNKAVQWICVISPVTLHAFSRQ